MTRIKSYWEWSLTLLIVISALAAIPVNAQTYTVLYNFGTRNGDPGNPMSNLVQGRDGALYSTSLKGGTNGDGAVFKVTPAGHVTVLYSFCSLAKCADGSFPSGLTLRPDGHFIGTTESGGSSNAGTIFDISQTGALTVLYSFTGGADGGLPFGPPIIANGAFYGTASSGGLAPGCGTLYKLVNPGGGFTVVHSFNSATEGCGPDEALVLGTDGNFYGPTNGGGAGEFGTIFQSTPAGKITVLHNFSAFNSGMLDPLIQGSDGNFYGTTVANPDGSVGGTVFQITPSGTFSILHTLNGTTDGSRLEAGLLQATDGNFYGVASAGGNSTHCPSGCGTLFQVTPGGSFSVLYNFFEDLTGAVPESTPFQNTNGILYGDTFVGGTAAVGSCPGCGVFYSWNADLPAFVSFVPDRGTVGSTIEVLGQGFTSSTTVSFDGTPATATVVSGNYLRAVVPSGATTGTVTVTTSSGTLTSNQKFLVTP